MSGIDSINGSRYNLPFFTTWKTAREAEGAKVYPTTAQTHRPLLTVFKLDCLTYWLFLAPASPLRRRPRLATVETMIGVVEEGAVVFGVLHEVAWGVVPRLGVSGCHIAYLVVEPAGEGENGAW